MMDWGHCLLLLLGFALGLGCGFPRMWKARRIICLSLLQHAGPEGAYGLDLVKDSKGILSRGSVYVLLSQLQDEGVVEKLDADPVWGLKKNVNERARYRLKVDHSA